MKQSNEPRQMYACSMHPEIRQDAPGNCPICGMALVPAKEKKDEEKRPHIHEKHKGHTPEMFKRKFLISLILTIPVVLYSDLIQEVLGFRMPAFPGSEFLPLALGSVVFFYGGWVFLVGAYRELKAKSPGMMTLIGMAILTAYIYSIATVITGIGRDLFWELTTLITIMLLGHWLEMRAVQGARGALKELAKLLPDTAEVVRDNRTEKVPLSELKAGDTVLVRPGGTVPADGIVIEGKSNVNEAMITGESRPVPKADGSEVIAGTISTDGALKIKITKIGEDTFLAGVMRLVSEAEASKSRLQLLSDRAAFYLTVVAISSGAVAFAFWAFARDDFVFAIERLVTVLVIACPHALGLAIPLVAAISTAMAAKSGLLVRRRLALEAARNIDVVMFDKTGTLTKGEYGVTRVVPAEYDEKTVLQLAASVDSKSEHFIAKAIVEDAKRKNVELLDVRDFEALAGRGVQGKIRGSQVLAGGEAILKEKNVTVPKDMKTEIDVLAREGKTIIYVIKDSNLAGAIALADIIREESKEAIRELKGMGVKVAMITGDSEEVARWASRELGIDEYFARVLPQEKSEKVRLLQERGQKIAMVGDGINDAPALVQADIGIAIGAGTNVAIESAGIILVRSDPRDIARIIRLSKSTYAKMMQNLFWATGYNIVAIPLAAGVLAGQGIVLQPAVGAIFMSASTVIVAINALLLRRAKL